MKIEIKPKANASKRTKERIKQHGPVFCLESKAIDALSNQWLFRAETGWFGWLPIEEFDIESVS